METKKEPEVKDDKAEKPAPREEKAKGKEEKQALEDNSKFKDIPKELLVCMACNKSMWNGMVSLEFFAIYQCSFNVFIALILVI